MSKLLNILLDKELIVHDQVFIDHEDENDIPDGATMLLADGATTTKANQSGRGKKTKDA